MTIRMDEGAAELLDTLHTLANSSFRERLSISSLMCSLFVSIFLSSIFFIPLLLIPCLHIL